MGPDFFHCFYRKIAIIYNQTFHGMELEEGEGMYKKLEEDQRRTKPPLRGLMRRLLLTDMVSSF